MNSSAADPQSDFQVELQRTVDRLLTMPLARLDRPDERGETPADLAHELSQSFANRTAVMSEQVRAPEVPRIKSHAAGSQLAVIAQEFAGAADAHELVRATQELRELRRAL